MTRPVPITQVASDTIRAQEAEIARLREAGQMALAAFDAMNAEKGSWKWGNWARPVPANSEVTDLESARAALKETPRQSS